MAEQDFVLCTYKDCKQPNPRIEIARIRWETAHLHEESDDFGRDLLVKLKELHTLPRTHASVNARTEAETGLRTRLRELQGRSQDLHDRLEKNHAELQVELPVLHDDLRDATKHLNMWAWHAAERKNSGERAWLSNWRSYRSVHDQRQTGDGDRARVVRRWPLLGSVVAEGVVAGMEVDAGPLQGLSIPTAWGSVYDEWEIGQSEQQVKV